MGIMRWLDTPQFAALMAIEDPWSYRVAADDAEADAECGRRSVLPARFVAVLLRARCRARNTCAMCRTPTIRSMRATRSRRCRRSMRRSPASTPRPQLLVDRRAHWADHRASRQHARRPSGSGRPRTRRRAISVWKRSGKMDNDDVAAIRTEHVDRAAGCPSERMDRSVRRADVCQRRPIPAHVHDRSRRDARSPTAPSAVISHKERHEATDCLSGRDDHPRGGSISQGASHRHHPGRRDRAARPASGRCSPTC